MFFILSKTLYYLVMPMVWLTVLLVYALFTRNLKRRKKCLIFAFIIVAFFGNDFIINEALTLWERKPVPISSLPQYHTGIVLTGVTNTEKAINDRVFFLRGADRLLHTVQLYKAGKLKKILISGGSGAILERNAPAEADQLKSAFLYCGVPATDLIIENQSRNTRENALFSKKTIDSLHLSGNFLLITSAFHMRRSEGCFQKAGIKADIYPVDYFTYDRKFTPDVLLIPSESAFGKWAILIHEITGYIVYKIMGYS